MPRATSCDGAATLAPPLRPLPLACPPGSLKYGSRCSESVSHTVEHHVYVHQNCASTVLWETVHAHCSNEMHNSDD